MSFREIVEGFASGFMEGAAHRLVASVGTSSNGRSSGRIARLCAEIGWEVDEQEGGTIRLHFKDPLVGLRKVVINNGDRGLVNFIVMSHAVNKATDVPDQVAGHLLVRNWELLIGTWEATVDEDGDALFCVAYTALGAGLDAEALKYICETMVNEALQFDRKMQAAGLLAS
jgi:Putative bacterial sensory transduction regulator